VDSQLFFFINVAFGGFFLVWFWIGRKNRGVMPTRLKLRNPQTQNTLVMSNSEKKSSTADEAIKNAKKLNVLFLYNGHDWDAHEVLGVPAGAGLSLVTERYQQLIKQADQGQIEFYQAAYQAILKNI
jgi:hypothetical protein